jgi:CDP-glucose 4,6-dehydratase
MDDELNGFHVLVTGASGFTGSWLVRRLVGLGAKITALSDSGSATVGIWPNPSPFEAAVHKDQICEVIGSVLDYDLLLRLIRGRNIDSVFHLAGLSTVGAAEVSPALAFDINSQGTLNVLEACRISTKPVRRIIVASTDKVYGDAESLPSSEGSPLKGLRPYEASKICADLIARSYANSFGLPIVVARLANVYGGGDYNWSRLVPNSIQRMLKGRRAIVKVPPGGHFKRDFLYVSDLMDAYLALFRYAVRADAPVRAFNIGTGQAWTASDIVRLIACAMGRGDLQPEFVRSADDHGEILHQQVTIEAAQTLLGWSPKHSLEEGIANTVQWYSRYLPMGDRE